MHWKQRVEVAFRRWTEKEISTADFVHTLFYLLNKRMIDAGLPFSGLEEARLIAALEAARPRFSDVLQVPAYAQRLVTAIVEARSDRKSEDLLGGMIYSDPDLGFLGVMIQSDPDFPSEPVEDSEATPLVHSPEEISFSSGGFAPVLNERLGTNADINLLTLIEQLKETDIQLARFAVLRLFGGLTLRELSERTGTPLVTVRRQWDILKTKLLPEGTQVSPLSILPVVDTSLLRTLYQHPELLRTLDWRVFEHLLATILERLGYEIELQRGTKDGGIDIFAIRNESAFGSHRYIVQAKRWANKVGIEPVRELLFLQHHHNVSKGCLAATSSFSRNAWTLANEYRWQIELRDIEGLQAWLKLAVQRQKL